MNFTSEKEIEGSSEEENPSTHGPGFPNLSTNDILDWIILYCWGTVLCIMGCLATSLACTYWMPVTMASTRNASSRHCQMSPGGQNHLQLRTDYQYSRIKSQDSRSDKVSFISLRHTFPCQSNFDS